MQEASDVSICSRPGLFIRVESLKDDQGNSPANIVCLPLRGKSCTLSASSAVWGRAIIGPGPRCTRRRWASQCVRLFSFLSPHFPFYQLDPLRNKWRVSSIRVLTYDNYYSWRPLYRKADAGGHARYPAQDRAHLRPAHAQDAVSVDDGLGLDYPVIPRCTRMVYEIGSRPGASVYTGLEVAYFIL